MGFKSNKKNKRNLVKPLEVVSADPSKADKPKDPTILPNTFKFAAESLKIMSERGGSAGSIVVNRYKSYNYKLIYALVMNTIKNIKIIKKIMHNLKLMNSISEDNPFLVEILIGDLLFGQGLKSVEKNPIAVAIKARKDDIIKEQTALKKELSSDGDHEVAKYLRINHLKSNMESVISQLKVAGLTQLEYSKDKIKFKKFINKYKTLDDNQYMLDFHFPNDLILVKQEAAGKLTKTDLLKKNKATFQDKASFMAVEAMDCKPNQNIIDACFAPGCKTSLIATKMRNKGKILAYDVDKRRLVSAIRFLKLQGVTCVRPECLDFSKVKLRRLPKIHKIESFDSIIIDPSCSGSGISSRVDYKKTDQEIGRLKKLNAFQVSLLKHAIQARVSKTIVYCTCSTSIEENEQVVEMALNESGVKDKWDIDHVIPYWPQRGDPKFEFGEKCLRSNSGNLTNGFFIAKLSCNDLYQCKGDDDTKEHANKKRRLETGARKLVQKGESPKGIQDDSDGDVEENDDDDDGDGDENEEEEDSVDDEEYEDAQDNSD